jgi:hypothetical protein
MPFDIRRPTTVASSAPGFKTRSSIRRLFEPELLSGGEQADGFA